MTGKIFFWISIPNSFSVSGSLLHIMKVLVNLKFTILRWSAVIPKAIISDPSAIFNLVVVVCIGVLKLLSIVWYVEYLMSDMAAPESIRALYHFPACTVIVGQSMMSATVTWSSKGSPPCLWESLLGEGSISLNDLCPLLSHWSDHWGCNNQWVDLPSSPSCSSWDVVFLLSCWIVNLIYMIHALKICRMVVNVTYCDLWTDNLKSFHV